MDIAVNIAIIAGGVISAVLLALFVKHLLRKTPLDEKLAKLITGDESHARVIEKWVSRSVFYITLAVTFITLLRRLDLSKASTRARNILSQDFIRITDILGIALDYASIEATLLGIVLAIGSTVIFVIL